MEQNDALVWGVLEGGDHPVEVEAAGFPREVGVALRGEFDVGEDLVVVGPCWRAHVDGLCFGIGGVVESVEEEGAKMGGTCAGDGLEGDGTFLGDGGGVGAQDELLGGGGEFGEAGYGEVFVVEVGVVAEAFVCLWSA